MVLDYHRTYVLNGGLIRCTRWEYRYYGPPSAWAPEAGRYEEIPGPIPGESEYQVYCTYVPTSFKHEYETKIFEILEEWGRINEKTLYVAPWNISNPLIYIELLNKIGFKKRPLIILSNKDIHKLRRTSFMIIINEPHLLRNVTKLGEILDTLLDLILQKKYNKATKEAIKEQDIAKIKSLSEPLAMILSKMDIIIKFMGLIIESKYKRP